MPGRKYEDLCTVAAFAEVESSGALSVRSGSGSDFQTECGSERTTYVSGWVKGGEVFVELRASRPGEERLPERNLDVGELKLLEKALATDSCDLGVLAGERPGLYADPSNGGTGGTRVLLDLDEADTVDSSPHNVNGI